ncbi:Ig-like domain-containing protein [Epilithonimonas sp.]|uniref:Ig-like domain-containing protein n=1 Tax=Epilithonimonas sp. TaxID=2894511 RepID=UPI00289CA16D|nr:Ig-like domain-containing protein [Epilithonimonas sp.]
MKKYLSLLFLISYFIVNAQTDLVRWALTSDGSVSYSSSKISATAVGTSQNPISYSSQGMTVTGWNNTNVEHYRYFGFSVGSANGSSLKISNLVFEQERLNTNIQNYTIRYYVAPNSNNVDDYNFFGTYSSILINNESIASNPVKNIPLNITISGTQRLIIKFYTSGTDWGAGWRIKANTLKLTEEQATVPVANNDSYSVYKNTSTNLNVLSNDTSGSTITGITITQQPAHGTVTVNGTTNVTYVPTAGYEGTDSFKYKAVNTTGSSNEATVGINVITAVPVANNDSYNVYNSGDSSLNILSNDTSTLTITGISITQQPTHGILTINGTTNVTYKPASTTYTGTDTFKYKVSNVTGDSNEATVSINVQQDPNTAVPVANNDTYTAYKNNESDFNVLSNDTSVLAINGVTITQQPNHGTLTVNGTTNITYKPATGYTGTDSFKYKASNSTGLSNEATVSINVVENVNTPLTRWNNSNFTASVYNTHINVGNITSTVSQSYVENISIGGYNAFQSSGWPDKNAVTIDKSKYIQFTISPKNGYKLNLSEFNFLCMTQGGDAKIKIDYSLNSNFTTFFNVLPETTVTSSMSTISLTNFSRPIATDGQVVYLRVYVYNTWNAFQILLRNGDNVGPAFIGNVEFSSTAPIAYDDTVANIVNNDIDINVLINDDYSNKINSLTFTQPSHGSATLNADRSINYVPTKDYIGADAFTYYITNEYGVSNTATVSINNGPNVTSPLIRWDNTNFTATPFQSFINSTTITSNGGTGITVGGETNPKVFYVETQSGQDNTNFNSSRYIQFVLDNISTNKTVEPKTFDYYAMGSDGAKYELRYSKTADFSSDVVVMATGNVPTAYALQNFTFDNGFKLAPGEKVYVRLYLYNTYYVQYKMQFITGGLGPEIDGIYYNQVNTSNDTIWLNPAAPHWSNGTPTATKNAIIDTSYDTTTYGNFVSSNLTINTGGTLTVNTGGYVTVNGQVLNNAAATGFVIENNANLLQNGTSVNTGNITVKKSAIIPKMGYNYWSSPVSGQNLYQFSDGYNQANGGTGTGTPWNRFYIYNEATDYFVTSITAENIALNSSSTFLPARGYAIRGKNSFPDNVTINTTAAQFQFVGTPQNGDINSYNLRWSGATKGYNMVGNPYPSNISFDDFYEHNKTKINGTAYFWTNNDEQITSQQSTNYSGNNYAILNSTGGASATYFGYNNRKPNGNIAVGQGFIIQAKEAGKGQPLNFTNAMRTPDIANYYNRGAQKNRFWLEFKSPTDVNNEILIGYIDNATNAFDIDYDADLLAIGSDSFWSILDSHKLAIQSKNPNFSLDDITKVGFKAAVSGNYTISLTDRNGIFEGAQTVYLKDKYLNKTVNMTDAPYIFYTNSGQYEDRFEIVYRSSITLGTTDEALKGIIITKDNQNFVVRSDDNINEVGLYDMAGRLLFNTTNAKKEVMINKTNLAEGMYIIKARSGNTIVTKKVLK